MIKRRLIIVNVLFLLTLSLSAQNRFYSIVTNPGEDASTQMNISFACDRNFEGKFDVEYCRESDQWRNSNHFRYVVERVCSVYDSIRSKKADGTDFVEYPSIKKCSAFLTDLEPNTRYKYRISSGGYTSDIHYFKTAGATSWSACIISDFHSYPPLPGRLKSASDMIETVAGKKGIDWVLSLGDVCAWGGSYSFWKRLYEEPSFKYYMWAGVNGNHDNMSRDYQLTGDYFRNANSYPTNGYRDQVGICYWFRYGKVLFIMLNNEAMHNDEGLIEAKEWVKNVLNDNVDADFKIVCEHYQWFDGEDGRARHYSRWKDVFDDYGVDLAIAGNNHIYLRTDCIYRGSSTNGSMGTVYLDTPSSDNERGCTMKAQPLENEDIILKRWTEGKRTVGAIRMDVTGSRIKLTLMDRNGNKIDKSFVKVKYKK